MTPLLQKAERFRAMHRGPRILLLANVWDCASARAVELAGADALATSSAGISFALGYPDGQRIPRTEMLDVVRRIAGAAELPVSADLEAGYGDIEATAVGLLDAGAVGLNLEDAEGGALIDPATHCERIRALRRAVPSAVINARTDVYLLEDGDPATRFDRSVDRLRAYIDAGADCVFVPGVWQEELIARLVGVLQFPLNVLAVKGTPPLERLQALGVARVSVGSGLMRSALGHTRRVAESLLREGRWEAMLDGAVPYAEANAWFGSRRAALVEHLRRTAGIVERGLAGLSAEAWTFRPPGGGWTIAEIAEHLRMVETQVLQMVRGLALTAAPNPATPEDAARKDEYLLRVVPVRRRKAEAGPSLTPTTTAATPAAAWETFRACREATLRYAESTTGNLRGHRQAHFALGELDSYQWLLFLALHAERHAAQIGEIREKAC